MRTKLRKILGEWTSSQLLWGLLFAALLLMLGQVPLVTMAHREAGTRAFLQAVCQSDPLSGISGWRVTVDADVEALELARQYLREVNSDLGVQQSRWNTYRTLGLIELVSNNTPGAQWFFLRRLETVPDDAFTRFFLGETYLRGGDTYAAIAQWKAAGAREPLMRLGEALQERGRQREAIAAFDAVSQLDPTDRESRRAAAGLVEEFDKQQALERYQEIIAIAPEWAVGYASSGSILFHEGRYERAIPLLEQALQCHPSEPGWIIELLGRSHAALGQWEEAVKAYEQAIRERPERPFTYVLMGDAQCQLGRPEEARFYYEQALKLGSRAKHLSEIIEHISRNGECPDQRGYSG